MTVQSIMASIFLLNSQQEIEIRTEKKNEWTIEERANKWINKPIKWTNV